MFQVHNVGKIKVYKLHYNNQYFTCMKSNIILTYRNQICKSRNEKCMNEFDRGKSWTLSL